MILIHKSDGVLYEFEGIDCITSTDKIDITIRLKVIMKDGKKAKRSYTYYYFEDLKEFLDKFEEAPAGEIKL